MNTKISEVGNKIPDTSGLVTATVFNTKLGEFYNKIPYHAKRISKPQFKKLTAGKLKQADLLIKTDFDNKLKTFLLQIKQKIQKFKRN